MFAPPPARLCRCDVEDAGLGMGAGAAVEDAGQGWVGDVREVRDDGPADERMGDEHRAEGTGDGLEQRIGTARLTGRVVV